VGAGVIDARAVATEGAVLGVFGIGWLVSRALRRPWRAAEVLTMYMVGMLFEVLTCFMWQYHHIFLVLPWPLDNDISILFPLGWAGMIMTATPVAERLAARWRARSGLARHLVLAGVWLVIGAAAETTFYRIGMIEYIRDARTEVNFLLGQAPGLPPTLVLLCYGITQPFFSRYLQWLERAPRRA